MQVKRKLESETHASGRFKKQSEGCFKFCFRVLRAPEYEQGMAIGLAQLLPTIQLR
jgi:hypothetical protein